MLKDCQKEDINLQAKWLEGVARVKASHEGNHDTAKTLQTMIQRIHDKRMHQKLSRIAKGAHEGLDFIKVPTGE